MHKFRFIALALAAGTLPAAPAAAQRLDPVGLAVDGTVGAAAESIRENANAIIQQLEQSFGISSFRARQDIAFLIAEIDDVATRQQSTLFRNLSRQQRDLFVNASNLLINARRQANATIEGASQVAATLENGITRLPFADRSPRVTRATPSYLLGRADAQPVRIEFKGSMLGSGPATLKLGRTACTLATQTDTLVAFDCPAAPFATAAGTATVRSDLVLTKPRGFLAGLFGRRPETKTYHLGTTIVPPTLGSYRIEGAYRGQDHQTVARTGRINASNGHCAGSRTHGPFRFSPASGYRIDPQSVRLGNTRSSNYAKVLGPDDVGSSGFYYRIKLENHGSCVRVLGQIVSRDARAWHDQEVAWTDFRDVPREEALALPGGEIAWGKQIAMPLPANLSWFRLTVDQIDGRSLVVTDQSDANPWFSVDLDAERRTLVLRPRHLDEAMGTD